MALTSPNAFFPLSGVSKKQTCVSHSTPEAEIVSANAAVRLEGLPALPLWDVMLERKVIATLLEDNQATANSQIRQESGFTSYCANPPGKFCLA